MVKLIVTLIVVALILGVLLDRFLLPKIYDWFKKKFGGK
jgi:H+/gluconate symporter-like permease